MAPDVDALEEQFGEFGVKFVTSLTDAGSPYSSEQWQSNFGDSDVPLVIDENQSSTGMFSLFHDSWNAFPTFAIIDHTMTVRAKPWTLNSNSNTNSCDGNSTTIDGFSGGSTVNFLQQLVDECGSLCEPCSGTIDSDGDGIADECDDCDNMAGDLNDDHIIDILDIVTAVNIVLNGGVDSPDFTECEKIDADMTGDGTINILDIIQIINAVLGNLNQYTTSSIEYMDVTSHMNNDNLYLTFTSEFATGLQLEFLGDISAINLVDNHNFILVSNLGDLNRCVVYSMNNKAFDELTLEIEGGDKVNIKDINIIAGDSNGENMSVRWESSQINNFALTNLYPNPFNPVTQIDYSVDRAGELRLSVFNLLGQEVAVLHNGFVGEGTYQAIWDASMLSSGVYYVNMLMHGQVETMKAVLVK